MSVIGRAKGRSPLCDVRAGESDAELGNDLACRPSPRGRDIRDSRCHHKGGLVETIARAQERDGIRSVV